MNSETALIHSVGSRRPRSHSAASGRNQRPVMLSEAKHLLLPHYKLTSPEKSRFFASLRMTYESPPTYGVVYSLARLGIFQKFIIQNS